jgi:hypothetical protein
MCGCVDVWMCVCVCVCLYENEYEYECEHDTLVQILFLRTVLYMCICGRICA